VISLLGTWVSKELCDTTVTSRPLLFSGYVGIGEKYVCFKNLATDLVLLILNLTQLETIKTVFMGIDRMPVYKRHIYNLTCITVPSNLISMLA